MAETTQELHAHGLDRMAECINPGCRKPIRVAGEFCRDCRVAQEQTKQERRRADARKPSY